MKFTTISMLTFTLAFALTGCGVVVAPGDGAAHDASSDASLDARDAGLISCQAGPCPAGMACNALPGPHCIALPVGCTVEPLRNCVDRECLTFPPCPDCMQAICPAGTQCLREWMPDESGNRRLPYGCVERDR
ncbi:MAG: hypothetical protein U0269_23660 [Polyangiales bacterium]